MQEVQGQTLQAGNLRLLPARRQVLSGGNEIHLTTKEFELLLLLAGADGDAVTRDRLQAVVWAGLSNGSRTLDVHINRLRGKLGPEGERIHTIRGYGYRMDLGNGREGLACTSTP